MVALLVSHVEHFLEDLWRKVRKIYSQAKVQSPLAILAKSVVELLANIANVANIGNIAIFLK